MARRSRLEAFKPKVFELFGRGLTPAEIRDRHPDIPTSTLYDWRKEYRLSLLANSGNQSGNQSGNSDSSGCAVDVEIVDDGETRDRSGPRLAVLPGKEESDYQLARRVAREVARNSKSDYNRIIAVGALAKLIEMKLSLPAAVLDGAEEKPLKDEVRGARSQSPEDLQQQFKDLLENTG